MTDYLSKYLMKSYWEIIDKSECQQLSPIIFVLRRERFPTSDNVVVKYLISREQTLAAPGKQTKNITGI